MHDYFKVPHVERMLLRRRYLAGEITYAQWAREEIKTWILRSATEQSLKEATRHLKLVPGAKATLRELKKQSQACVNQ
ncbi:MAG: hypothetical protein QXK37_03570 [Candidatus Woesearchaeota archaeon]